MSDDDKEDVSKINIAKKYNELLAQIPWDDMRALPEKLSKLEAHPIAKALGIKNLGDFDVAGPIKDVVEYLGILVRRLRLSEKKVAIHDTDIVSIKERLEALEKTE